MARHGEGSPGTLTDDPTWNEVGEVVEEADGRLTWVRTEFHPSAMTAAAGDPHTGAMLALVPSPDDLDRLAIDGGEPRDELHLTLFYLGEAADLGGDTVDALKEIAASTVALTPPVETAAFGVGLWNWAGDEPSIVLNVQDQDGALARVRAYLGSSAADWLLGDWPPVEQHRPWVPHVCLAYSTDDAVVRAALDRVGTITFDVLRLAVAEDVFDYPLGGESTS